MFLPEANETEANETEANEPKEETLAKAEGITFFLVFFFYFLPLEEKNQRKKLKEGKQKEGKQKEGKQKKKELPLVKRRETKDF